MEFTTTATPTNTAPPSTKYQPTLDEAIDTYFLAIQFLAEAFEKSDKTYANATKELGIITSVSGIADSVGDAPATIANALSPWLDKVRPNLLTQLGERISADLSNISNEDITGYKVHPKPIWCHGSADTADEIKKRVSLLLDIPISVALATKQTDGTSSAAQGKPPTTKSLKISWIGRWTPDKGWETDRNSPSEVNSWRLSNAPSATSLRHGIPQKLTAE